MRPDLTRISHRPWPLPGSPYIIEMGWHDLLFAHWPVPVQALRPLIPSHLTIDLFEGEAWLGVVPFWMSGVRIRPLPGMPTATRFPEINVRTYVCEGDKPGVYFFSLDAASLMAVKGARLWYHLPYYHARMEADIRNDTVHYKSSRRVRPGTDPVQFEGTYRPTGPATCGECGPLAHWLTERYCLYAEAPRTGRIYRADIHHDMWPLQPAEVEFKLNTMTAPLGIKLQGPPPLLHFARHLSVAAWPPVRIK